MDYLGIESYPYETNDPDLQNIVLSVRIDLDKYILETLGFWAPRTWPHSYRGLLYKVNRTRQEEYNIFHFLIVNGMMPEIAAYVVQYMTHELPRLYIGPRINGVVYNVNEMLTELKTPSGYNRFMQRQSYSMELRRNI